MVCFVSTAVLAIVVVMQNVALAYLVRPMGQVPFFYEIESLLEVPILFVIVVALGQRVFGPQCAHSRSVSFDLDWFFA